MMNTDLDTHNAPQPQPKQKIELPQIVREYYDNLRGNPARYDEIVVEYVDELWRQANEFARRHELPCPVHRAELEALRQLAERRR